MLSLDEKKNRGIENLEVNEERGKTWCVFFLYCVLLMKFFFVPYVGGCSNNKKITTIYKKTNAH
jgi:hypothetical protein